MPLYRYEAIADRGKKVVGTIDAESLSDAKVKLIRRQIAAIQVFPLEEGQMRSRLSKKELLTLTRELSRLLRAGLSLFEALSALEEKYRGHKISALLLDLCEQVRSGTSFSQALASHGKIFDLLYTAIIANAEKTGGLPQALDEIAFFLSRQMQVRKQILSALLYPSLLALFCGTVLSSLLFFVIPSLRELFEGRDLHPFTRIVFACSQFACHAKGALFAILLLFTASGSALVFSSKWKKKIRSIAFRLPLFKNLLAKIAFVRFCRSAAALLEGGLPAVTAFAQARQAMRHPVLEDVIAQAEEKLSQGEALHVPFQNHPLIPPLVPRMMAIAQQGGKLAFTMQQMAQIYEEELETFLSHFAAVAQPALLLILGLLVGFVLLSVLLPLTDVSSFITSS